MTYYVLRQDLNGGPASVLPEYLDTVDLIDVTKHGDLFRVYLDPNTGEIHDGAVYAKEMQS